MTLLSLYNESARLFIGEDKEIIYTEYVTNARASLLASSIILNPFLDLLSQLFQTVSFSLLKFKC